MPQLTTIYLLQGIKKRIENKQTNKQEAVKLRHKEREKEGRNSKMNARKIHEIQGLAPHSKISIW